MRTALAFGSTTIRQTAIIEREKLLVAQGVGAPNGHELRTPLASIRIFANAIQHQASLALEGPEADKTLEASSSDAATVERLRAGSHPGSSTAIGPHPLLRRVRPEAQAS